MAVVDVHSPMTGSIKELLCAPGDRVREGDEILLLESMKMEIPVESPAAGTIVEVAVRPGQPVQEGLLLCRIECA